MCCNVGFKHVPQIPTTFVVKRRNLVMIGPNKLNHLHTAALTGGGGWHVMLKGENFKN